MASTGLVANLSRRSPSSSKRRTTRSAVHTASLDPLGAHAAAVTFAAPSHNTTTARYHIGCHGNRKGGTWGSSSVFKCFNCMIRGGSFACEALLSRVCGVSPNVAMETARHLSTFQILCPIYLHSKFSHY